MEIDEEYLRARYSRINIEELLELHANEENLTKVAKLLLHEELSKRGIDNVHELSDYEINKIIEAKTIREKGLDLPAKKTRRDILGAFLFVIPIGWLYLSVRTIRESISIYDIGTIMANSSMDAADIIIGLFAILLIGASIIYLLAALGFEKLPTDDETTSIGWRWLRFLFTTAFAAILISGLIKKVTEDIKFLEIENNNTFISTGKFVRTAFECKRMGGFVSHDRKRCLIVSKK